MRLLDRLGRTPMLIVLGWIVAAFLAVLVGVVGIGLVGSGLLSTRQGAPVSEDEVRRALEGIGEPSEPEPEPARSESPSESARPVPSTLAPNRSFPTRGGTVVADCDRILSMSPAQGFAVHDQDAAEGEFRGSLERTKHVKVEVELAGCDLGVPRLDIRVDED